MFEFLLSRKDILTGSCRKDKMKNVTTEMNFNDSYFVIIADVNSGLLRMNRYIYTTNLNC